jgi:hypothetical protein
VTTPQQPHDPNRPPLPSSAAEGDQALQFEYAEPAGAEGQAPLGPQAMTCATCGQPIADVYYAAGDKVICPRCRDALLATRTGGSRARRLFKATAFGLMAAVAGTLVWYGVRRLTGYEIGLIAIVVGLMVGAAVRAGSGGRGGRGYQVLAVLLTYFSIASNYVPDVVQELMRTFREDQGQVAVDSTPSVSGTTATQPATTSATAEENDNASISQSADDEAPSLAGGLVALVVLVVLVFAIALAAPFLAGAQNIIGLLIIGFALWEAWKMNQRQDLALAGPFRVGEAPPPMPPPAPAPRA